MYIILFVMFYLYFWYNYQDLSNLLYDIFLRILTVLWFILNKWWIKMWLIRLPLDNNTQHFKPPNVLPLLCRWKPINWALILGCCLKINNVEAETLVSETVLLTLVTSEEELVDSGSTSSFESSSHKVNWGPK